MMHDGMSYDPIQGQGHEMINFPTIRKFSDRLKFRVDSSPSVPYYDATDNSHGNKKG